MIVKSGRLYLWKNDISNSEIIVKVGTGTGTNDYVQITDSDMANEVANATIHVTNEASYDNGYDDNINWQSSLKKGQGLISISDCIDDDNRKIVIYVKIEATVEAFNLNEIGLFVKQRDTDEGVTPEEYTYVMISRNIVHSQTVSHSSAKVLKYTINI